MKFLLHIIAVYLLMLSAVPCCAFDSCPDDKTEQEDRDQNGDKDCGTCSPFFNCEGCATATITPKFIQFDFEITSPNSVKAVYTEQRLPAVEYDFWQPPRLG